VDRTRCLGMTGVILLLPFRRYNRLAKACRPRDDAYCAGGRNGSLGSRITSRTFICWEGYVKISQSGVCTRRGIDILVLYRLLIDMCVSFVLWKSTVRPMSWAREQYC
jgi:hypothetical protein